jgi:probable DNA repair protein
MTITPPSTLYLCATSRLAQHIKLQQAPRPEEGIALAATLQALTLTQWLDGLFEEMCLRGLCALPELQANVLSPFSERIVWEQVIAQQLGDDAKNQFNIAALAQSAMQAHELCVVWSVPLDVDALDETRALAQWQQGFLEQCAERHLVDSARWQQAVVANLRDVADQLHWPKKVFFVGFSRLNPIETALMEVLQALHIDAGEVASSAPAQSITACSYPDAAAEALAAALWAKEQMALQPQGRFALVVPDLAGSRYLLQDALEDVLLPHAAWATQAECERPFNISLGTPLAQFGLVHCALQLLHLMGSAYRLEQSTMSELLRSPYWSDVAFEINQRALMEAQLRKNMAPAAPLDQYIQQTERSLRDKETNCLHHLRALQGAAAQAKQRHAPSHWARQLPHLLQKTGWLFERKLSSHEFQTQDTLLECIQAVGQLDDLLGAISLPEFATQLRRMCQERTFQPQTEGEPPLQVLGLLEASGLRFDAVWVMGMQDSAWPPPARPNPLLTAQAQRSVHAPNASASIQLAFAQSLQQMLQASAPSVIFSWARSAGASECNPSRLIPDTAPDAHLPCPASPHWTLQAAQSKGAMLDAPITDSTAPAVTDAEQVRGGTWLLRAQAICPAWGYFQYRLGANKLEEPTEGLDARQKGTFLHQALEVFWNNVKTSAALHALTEEERSAQVNQSVTQVLDAHNADDKNVKLAPRLQQLEQNRLTRLINHWLLLELAREQPFTVLEHERTVDVNTQGIAFTLKMDRLDQLDDGSLLVLDYKTGASIDTRNWASNRLTEPQLPIYAAVQPPPEGPVVGVVFAKVRMHDPAWAGLTQDDKVLPQVPGLNSKPGRRVFAETQFPDWNSVLQHWRGAIDNVALEIKNGDAGVRFDNADDLRYCDVRPLLRLEERHAQLQALHATRQTQNDSTP